MSLPSLLPLLAAALVTEAAAPDLVHLASMAQSGAEVYFQPGDLLVGSPTLPGRPAVRPLVGSQPVMLPTDLSGFEHLSRTCPASEAAYQQASTEGRADLAAGRLLARGDVSGDGRIETVVARRTVENGPLEVRVMRGSQVLGRATLPGLALPCGGLVAEVDGSHTPRAVVVWSAWGVAGRTTGVEVYGLPDDAPAQPEP